jgi:hypothetical protein
LAQPTSDAGPHPVELKPDRKARNDTPVRNPLSVSRKVSSPESISITGCITNI